MTAPNKLSQSLATVVGETPDYRFYYLSELLGRVVAAPGDKSLGRIKDVVARLAAPYPQVAGLLLDHGWGKPNEFVPWERVETFAPGRILVRLQDGDEPYRPYVEQAGWILLSEHLMRQTILDIDGRQTKQVNDIHLLESKLRMLLVHVDVAEPGLLQRVGVAGKRELISWRVFRPLTVEDAATDTVMLTVTKKHTKYLPSDDLVAALEELKRQEHAGGEAHHPADAAPAGLPVAKDFVAVGRGVTAGELLRQLRHSAHEPDAISTVFVVTDDQALQGAIALPAIVLAPDETPMERLMSAAAITVKPTSSRAEVEAAFRSAGARILPVVDPHGILVGVLRRSDVIR